MARPILILLTGIIAIFLMTDPALGHRSFGILYPESDADSIASGDAEVIERSGISWVLLQEIPSEETREAIQNYDLSAYVLIPEYYPVPYRLMSDKFGYFQRADSIMSNLTNYDFVKGFGLFSYGSWQERNLPGRLASLSEPYRSDRMIFTLDLRPLTGTRLDPFDGILLYVENAGELENRLAAGPDVTGVYYRPRSETLDLRDFQHLMSLMEDMRDIPVFFNRDWFLKNAGENEGNMKNNLSEITHYYQKVDDARFANPAPADQDRDLNGSMVLLFLFWLVYAGYYRMNPVYRKSIARFFLNYDFFVNDILLRRIRLPVDGLIMYAITCILAGILGFAISDMVLDPISREALMFYTPIIPYHWSSPGVFFLLFFAVTALLLGVQIIWIRIANRQHGHTDQISTFVLWPNHINFLIVTFGVILMRSFPDTLLASTLIVVFFGIMFVSFFTSAYNMRRIIPTSPFYMTGTYVLFILVSTTVLSWLIFGFDLLKAWDLAASLASA
ncbi:hypothetical protein [Natronogracilivirga saccharolytica]|uniref:Uncharacterized protein n=1 Tax=Natronogracilivirga saccharolytica TaxID=2812953 RepID=A0A8J7RQE6_9BACT|nr:hypothetical protein [Natronogracilivirga saccharolytica]MBP3191112.1 hypothetical protein [Natronogracilivirga saccharolytica]